MAGKVFGFVGDWLRKALLTFIYSRGAQTIEAIMRPHIPRITRSLRRRLSRFLADDHAFCGAWSQRWLRLFSVGFSWSVLQKPVTSLQFLACFVWTIEHIGGSCLEIAFKPLMGV